MEPAKAPESDPPATPPAGHPRDFLTHTITRTQLAGIGVLLALAVLCVFGRAVRYDFVNYDDDEYIAANPHVQHGLTWEGVKWAFETSFTSNWHPLTWLSLMLDVDLFGPGPEGPHLTNVLLHAVNSVLVFLLLARLTGALWRSAGVAALFALHPLRVESVAWVSERKDVLSAAFGLLTLLMYVRHAADSGRGAAWREFFASRNYRRALIFFALGLMSKPMLVTLPIVMLLLDYWPLRRPAGSASGALRLLTEKIPFLVMSLASSVITLIAQKGAIQPLAHISLGIRAVNAVDACARYLYKAFWPVNLAIPYLHPGYGSFSLFCISAALIVVVTLAVIGWRVEFPFLITGWFWFLGMLLPVIGLVQVGMQSMADRYTYLPLVGVFIMVVWAVGEFAARAKIPDLVIGGAAGALLAGSALRSMDQLQYWKNSETLFRHTLEVTGNNEIAYYNLGHYYSGQERTGEAIACYREAIRIKPDYDDALHNLGVVLARDGKLDAAIGPIREAIRYRPDKPDAYFNLGNVFALQHKYAEAAGAYTNALRLKPDYPEVHNNLANVLIQQGRTNEAIFHYRQVLRLKPDHEGARRELQALGATP